MLRYRDRGIAISLTTPPTRYNDGQTGKCQRNSATKIMPELYVCPFNNSRSTEWISNLFSDMELSLSEHFKSNLCFTGSDLLPGQTKS